MMSHKQTIDDAKVTLDVVLSDTILDLKKTVEKWTGLIPSDQRLIFCGKSLADDRPLASYGIKSLYTIHLVRRYKGA
jgi:ubiquitin-like protein Nedd8